MMTETSAQHQWVQLLMSFGHIPSFTKEEPIFVDVFFELYSMSKEAALL
jgi:hypothetical protein